MLWDFFAATVRAYFSLLMAVSSVAVMLLSISENVTCTVGKVFLAAKNNEYLISVVSTDAARKSNIFVQGVLNMSLTPAKKCYCT